MADEARRKPFQLLRSFALADFITLANAACGTVAILLCVSHVEAGDSGLLWGAFVMFPLALVADALDGRVARWRRRQSMLGADLDSLADVISFGVAPAVLGYTVGLRGGWDGVVLVYFVVCGISRLARYNVTAANLADEKGKVRYYEGAPIPTSVGIVAVLAIAHGVGAVGADLWMGVWDLGPWQLHPLVLVYALSGSLMIGTFRIPKP